MMKQAVPDQDKKKTSPAKTEVRTRNSTIAQPDESPTKKAETEVRNEKIRVAIRVRPQLKSEVAKECVCHVGKSVSNATLTYEKYIGAANSRAGRDPHD